MAQQLLVLCAPGHENLLNRHNVVAADPCTARRCIKTHHSYAALVVLWILPYHGQQQKQKN